MQANTVTHPTIFTISGMRFQVIALTALTEQQAAKVAMAFFRRHRFTKRDQDKLFQVQTLFETIALL